MIHKYMIRISNFPSNQRNANENAITLSFELVKVDIVNSV